MVDLDIDLIKFKMLRNNFSRGGTVALSLKSIIIDKTIFTKACVFSIIVSILL